MALAKMNKAVVVTGDGRMHFRAEDFGGYGFILEKCLNRVDTKLKPDY